MKWWNRHGNVCVFSTLCNWWWVSADTGLKGQSILISVKNCDQWVSLSCQGSSLTNPSSVYRIKVITFTLWELIGLLAFLVSPRFKGISLRLQGVTYSLVPVGNRCPCFGWGVCWAVSHFPFLQSLGFLSVCEDSGCCVAPLFPFRIALLSPISRLGSCWTGDHWAAKYASLAICYL